jgi:hypothetical protein
MSYIQYVAVGVFLFQKNVRKAPKSRYFLREFVKALQISAQFHNIYFLLFSFALRRAKHFYSVNICVQKFAKPLCFGTIQENFVTVTQNIRYIMCHVICSILNMWSFGPRILVIVPKEGPRTLLQFLRPHQARFKIMILGIFVSFEFAQKYAICIRQCDKSATSVFTNFNSFTALYKV